MEVFLHSFFFIIIILETDPRALYVSGKSSATEARPLAHCRYVSFILLVCFFEIVITMVALPHRLGCRSPSSCPSFRALGSRAGATISG